MLDKSNDYRPDIDGLRALAILPVVVSHAFPKLLPGGFVGVDVFFVISGFLITRLIVTALEESRFSIVDFYLRRIRRIFPALLLLLVVSVSMGRLLLDERDSAYVNRHALSALFFVSNFVLRDEATTSMRTAEQKPLAHLWSLSLEEQFYLVWPLLLVMLWRLNFRSRQSLSIAIAVLLVASLIAYSILVARDRTLTFFNPLTRFWEILAGALLALNPLVSSTKVKESISALGLFLLLFACFWFQKFSFLSGFVAVISAVFLIAAPGTSIGRHLLSLRPLVFVGLISYPLYLWHLPLMRFGYLESMASPPSSLFLAISILTSFLLAWMTYRFVEVPIRRRVMRR